MGEFCTEQYERFREEHSIVKNWWVMLLISYDNGEHTDIIITDEPRERFDRLENETGIKWKLGVLVNCGNQLQAQQWSKHITGDTQQIRGAMSRTAMISLLAQKYGREGYSDMDVVFKLPGAEEMLERI